jgi:lipopolysaccharide/colanic/teichoic acid biosynthesis glycosyltransferase/O-antigen/teichoic acid export membrane protein
MAILPRTTGAPHELRAAGLVSRASVTNLGAQGVALASVSVASLMVARVGGPTVVGEYALVRVLPWLFGVLLSCGLPTASAFFLAGDHGRDRSLRPTLALMTIGGAALGTVTWLACAVPFQHVFFRQLPIGQVMILAVLVTTQLGTVAAKACCQGSGDIFGANLVIVAEELWFVFVYPAVLLSGREHGVAAVILALIISGGLATLTSLLRLLWRGFFAGWGAPSASLARKIAAFGSRGQLGNMLWLMNLRFDFLLLGALAGPAVLGIYAVASKFAELMRLVPTAINYVLYPRFARLGPARATQEARRLLPRAAALTLAMTPVLAVVCYIALPIFYGAAFRGAVGPAEVITIGLSIEGAAAVASAYLLGCGRPGLNSVAMGTGATITVTLDVVLIPLLGAMGGAITSAITYLTTTAMLTLLARRLARRIEPSRGPQPGSSHPTLRIDTRSRRMVDCLVACVALLLVSPLLLAVAVAVALSSRGPVLYKQARVGKSGEPFTMLKFRTMAPGADSAGPLVTDQADPRVTWLGSRLRTTKLDELPQLLNVARGDMTLIGPRPEVPHFIPCYRQDELSILRVRPGLTGAGQIFYSELPAAQQDETADAEERYVSFQLHPKLAVDLDYLCRRSLGMDLRIVAGTVAVILRRPRPAPMTTVTPDAARL